MYKRKSALVLYLLLVMVATGYSKDFPYLEITLEGVSRYNEDRMAYQQVEEVIDPEVHQKQDTSTASLLIIKDKNMYLFKDGYDDPKVVEQNRLIREMENRLVLNDMWARAIDGKPDYLVITDRRTEIDPAPTIEFSPMCTPLHIIAESPIHTPFSSTTAAFFPGDAVLSFISCQSASMI